jgi:hypothetical protein
MASGSVAGTRLRDAVDMDTDLLLRLAGWGLVLAIGVAGFARGGDASAKLARLGVLLLAGYLGAAAVSFLWLTLFRHFPLGSAGETAFRLPLELAGRILG